jgi:hypothetical protein
VWINKEIITWFTSLKTTAEQHAAVSVVALQGLQEELIKVRTERDMLQKELQAQQINSDWFRMKVNTLELERAGLIKKAYNIDLPAPEIMKVAKEEPFPGKQDLFGDLGDEVARTLGYQTYDKQ